MMKEAIRNYIEEFLRNYEDGTGANSVGSEVCGKCVTGSPCAFWKLK